tara:strand:+ start:159 stop:590 length:432 start_codon:yes stop_codon:yes gene_type:complete
MSNKIRLIVFIGTVLFIFYTIFSEVFDSKKEVTSFSPPPTFVKEKTINNTFTINNICDCYDKAFNFLDKALEIRKSFKSFEEFSKNNKSVKEIEGYKKNYQNLQLQCVEKYQRQMFMDQSCKVGNQDELMKRRNKLNQMGIKI